MDDESGESMEPTEEVPLYIDRAMPEPFQYVTPKCPFPCVDLDPRLTRGSMGYLESTTQTPSRSAKPFCRAQQSVQRTDRQTDRQTAL